MFLYPKLRRILCESQEPVPVLGLKLLACLAEKDKKVLRQAGDKVSFKHIVAELFD